MTLTAQENASAGVEPKSLLSRINELILQSPDPQLQYILDVIAAEVRSFLGTDRVKIYQFHADGSGLVIAESINDNRLPSLLGLNFPADDIPDSTRELFIKARMRSVVDVAGGKLGKSLLQNSDSPGNIFGELQYVPLDPCHQEYLTAMGVQSSLIIPIMQKEQLWGLLVSHHSQPRRIPEPELQSLQMVVDQLSIAIAQANLLAQARQKADREATINRIATLFHSLPNIDLQEALLETVKVFQGSGGRIFIKTENFKVQNNLNGSTPKPLDSNEELFRLFTYGTQPVIPAQGMYPMMEQYSCWWRYFESEEHQVWAISDLYKMPQLRNLQLAFRPTKIRGILMVPLRYGQQILGYLSIFRDESDAEVLWAGEFDPDQRQQQPRQSFEIWKQLKQGQASEWTVDELETLKALGQRFSTAIVQYETHQQLSSFNTALERQVQERTAKLEQAQEQQQSLFEVVAKMRQSLDLEKIFSTMAQEVRRVLKVERVMIYRFDPDSEFNYGEVVAEDVLPEFMVALGAKVHDHCFGETYATKYTKGRVNALTDIHQAGLKDCYVAVLEQFQIRASLTAPVLKGEQLWGLLCIHQCSQPRNWQVPEIQFARQIAAQVSIALEQADLLTKTRQQAIDLQQTAKQEQALFAVVTRVRESLDVKTVFQTTTQEVRQLLQVERVTVYRFNPDWGGEFLNDFESSAPEWQNVGRLGENLVWNDTYVQETQGGRYRENKAFVVNDIYQVELTPCHLDVLEQFHIKAFATAPIFVGQQLWGILAAYQHSAPHNWQESEVKFLRQVAAQMGVAIQQADSLTKTRQQSQQLTQTIQELQETQTQLIQTEKMSSLGQLVAGIAHEINNPVNFIHGNLTYVNKYVQELLSFLHLYQQHYPEPSTEISERSEEMEVDFLIEDLAKMLDSMQLGTDRIRQIIQSLLNFSRLDQAEIKAVDIHEGLESTLLILQHRLKATSERPKIAVIKEYGDLPLVECYAGQLNQVFMNIISNAIDILDNPSQSYSDNYNGQITLRTAMVEEDNHQTKIAICIADNGPGMPEEVRTRLFEPFFTTKPVGKGTGLGLSISYQIVVDKHGGVLSCNSSPQGGTEFWLELPVQR